MSHVSVETAKRRVVKGQKKTKKKKNTERNNMRHGEINTTITAATYVL
jgi:hypothetical protein